MPIFSWFESLLNPFPKAQMQVPEKALWPFLWRNVKGVKRYLFGMTIFTAMIAAFEAFLFGAMGRIVDWLSNIQPENLWAQEGQYIWGFVLVLVLSIVPIAMTTLLKHQTLAETRPANSS